MKKYKIAILDDYQNAALESADWSVLRDRADISVFQDHLADPDALIERLQPFDVICVMRERSPGPGNASIDVAAAGDHGIPVVHTDGGSIILNASIDASKGIGNLSVYSATKAAVRSFARTWTVDLKDRRIRVNALSPGYIDTAPWRSDSVAEIRASIMSSGTVPSGRFGTSDEVAKVAVCLASDHSSYVNGDAKRH